MFKNKKNEKSIRTKLISMVLLPILALALMIISIGIVVLYQFYTKSVRNELTAATNTVLDCLNLTVKGDYAYESGMLIKGDLNITDSTMLYRIKDKSQIDITIFWEDTRILSTVADASGVSAVGTKANKEVAEAVLERGECYYSTSLDISGVPYIGYYMPIENVDHTVVGMIFAGKSKELVYRELRTVLLWFLAFSGIAGILAAMFSSIYANRMVADINIINKFIKTIAEGDLTANLDKRIAGRNDELGRIGEYASRMGKDLKKLIERDPLTTLYNRRSCNNKLKVLESEKSQYTIVMCDIDWFKKINDAYGHDAGDYVLVTLSELIWANVRGCGFASRWGGEEFLLVYQLEYEAAMEKVRQIQQEVRAYDFTYEGKTIKVTMSFGVEMEDASMPYEQRILIADENLYIAKNNGRDRIVDRRKDEVSD